MHSIGESTQRGDVEIGEEAADSSASTQKPRVKVSSMNVSSGDKSVREKDQLPKTHVFQIPVQRRS